jgi:hypothetical protein
MGRRVGAVIRPVPVEGGWSVAGIPALKAGCDACADKNELQLGESELLPVVALDWAEVLTGLVPASSPGVSQEAQHMDVHAGDEGGARGRLCRAVQAGAEGGNGPQHGPQVLMFGTSDRT